METTNGSFFSRLAKSISNVTGRPVATIVAMGLIVLWAVSRPLFDSTDTWMLIVNTGTTIVTFLMVFLIQNSQNRDTLALQIKLDEVIRCIKEASNEMLDLEDRGTSELESKRQEMVEIAQNERASS